MPLSTVYVIQFITDEPLMIPGTGGVAVRGQVLEIGPGRAGANFPYRSPRGQIQHYKGRQHYMLIDAVSDDGKRIKNHPDLNVVIGAKDINLEDQSWEPPLQNRGTNVVGESAMPTEEPEVKRTKVKKTKIKDLAEGKKISKKTKKSSEKKKASKDKKKKGDQ